MKIFVVNDICFADMGLGNRDLHVAAVDLVRLFHLFALSR
jgi:hypothetical protein